jgi:hypothetical protein
MDFDFSGGRLKPLDGTFCYWSKCGEAPVTDGLCAEHAAACKCRGTPEHPSSHFPGDGCDTDLNADGICRACVEEPCRATPGTTGEPRHTPETP